LAGFFSLVIPSWGRQVLFLVILRDAQDELANDLPQKEIGKPTQPGPILGNLTFLERHFGNRPMDQLLRSVAAQDRIIGIRRLCGIGYPSRRYKSLGITKAG
jgi:hypothetical protein